jgi:hypothetical protein
LEMGSHKLFARASLKLALAFFFFF